MANLQLAVNGEYFDQMKRGEKVEEYRLVNPYWCRRLSNGHNQQLPRRFDRLIITRGYPKRDDASKRIDVPYAGYEVKVITHPHFGPDPVKVFAIKVNIDGQ
ncbi:ASCH domain-containing protein [Salmonella enterica subsp. enterica]|nr:ASCH domain-containing protein [Salmonella enterica subsp. enterica]EDT7019728.1 ASCH domain-containing protein [Salmonella enterica subsp. enterica]EEA8587324.1 ASCH domain-containing protein [Salmonella enterica subsp. enterica]EEC0353862.1 ASCH domain-containing protein [Salmonella enterica subsp. enterica]